VNQDHHNHYQEKGTEDTNRPLSPWLVMTFMLALCWGAFYLAFNSGGFSQDVYESNAVNWAGGGAQVAVVVDPKVVGKRLYTQNCAVCHQASGMGVAGQFPPLVGSEWVNYDTKHGENHLVLILLHGHQGPMNVMGSVYNNAMPQWKQLADDQIADILTYIRNDWGNNGDAVSPSYVAQLRKEHNDQSEAWAQSQLMAMAPAKEGASSTAPTTK